MLIAGLTDCDDIVREKITSALNENQNYDEFLAQKDNLDILFIGVNDSSFTVRSNVVSTIGRLSSIHSIIVLPHIREILQSLLFELDFSQIKETKLENCKLLCTIVQHCIDLIKPFIKQVCRTILTVISKTDPLQYSELITVCLFTIGELFSQCGTELLEFLQETVDAIVQ